MNNVLLDLIKLILEKYANISEEILHTDHSLANNIFLQFQSIYEHLIRQGMNDDDNNNDNERDLQLKLEFIEKTATHAWEYLHQASTAKTFLSSEWMERLLVDVETQEGNSSIADSLNNIGIVYQEKGDYDEALVYYQKALKIKYRVFGVDENQVETQGNSSIAQSLSLIHI